MILFATFSNLAIFIKNFFLYFKYIFLLITLLSFLKKKTKERDTSNKTKEKDKGKGEYGEEVKGRHSKVEFETMVIEQPELNDETPQIKLETQKRESLLVPSKTKTQIEKIVLKILYKEKAVKTLKLLNDKVLESAALQKITVSEKVINLIINQMNKNKQIEFTQKEGWKIKI